jgi:hypothetical protein
MLKALKEHWIELILVVGIMIWGVSMLATASGENAFAAAPEVSLSELKQHAGTGIPVRVRARAVAEPALQTPGGEALAFQAVTVSHEESGDSDEPSETVIDYAGTTPQTVWISDGSGAVPVQAAGIDLRFVPELAKGSTARGGALPPELARNVAAAFRNLPGGSGLDVVVRGIPNGEEVTVFGVVDSYNDQPVIQSPRDGKLLVVSPMEPAQLLAAVSSSASWNSWIGWLLLLGPPLVVAAVVWRRRQLT